MRAIHRIGEQRAQRVARGVEVVDGFEQRRDVERHAAVAIDAAGHACECEHRQRVGRAAAHADDVGAERLRAVTRAQSRDGAEHVQGRPRGAVADAAHRLAAVEQAMQALGAFLA